jgi:glutamine cyclotransferase
MRNLALAVTLIFFTVSSYACSSCIRPPVESGNDTPTQPVVYSFEVVDKYPHDPRAFTQGLVYANGVLYEGTGLVGESSLRRVDLITGQVQQVRNLTEPFFGEGITVFKDSIYQLTWQSRVGLVYNRDTFEEKHRFSYSTEGWGLTQDGKRLIMSDGTTRLQYLDPQTLEVTGNVDVYGALEAIGELRLNELEFVQGEVFANVWPTNYIVRIDPSTGRVTGWVNMAGILEAYTGEHNVDVINGIAYDAPNDRLFITGKLWPWLFEIKMKRQE